MYHCATLCSEELSGRITDSCYLGGVGQCPLENHNKRQQCPPSVQQPQQPCCDIEQDGGNNQQRTLTWLSSVTSPLSRPRLTPTCTAEQRRRKSWARRGPPAPWARVTFSARVSQVAPCWPPPPSLHHHRHFVYNVYWATLWLTLQSAIARHVSIIATQPRNNVNQTQELLQYFR